MTGDDRLDRNDIYLGVLQALWLASIAILVAPIAQGAVATMDWDTQKIWATTMLVGTTVALTGAWCGSGGMGPVSRRFLPRMNREYAYLLGSGGLVATSAALAVFAWVVITESTVIGTATGAMTPILAYRYARMSCKLWREHRTLAQQRRLLEGEFGL